MAEKEKLISAEDVFRDMNIIKHLLKIKGDENCELIF